MLASTAITIAAAPSGQLEEARRKCLDDKSSSDATLDYHTQNPLYYLRDVYQQHHHHQQPTITSLAGCGIKMDNLRHTDGEWRI